MLSSSEWCHRTKRLQDADAKMQLNMMKRLLMEVFKDTHSCLGRYEFHVPTIFKQSLIGMFRGDSCI